jgi:hypothetical protein
VRRLLVILAVTAIAASRAYAGAANLNPSEMKGHSLGETTAAFLSVEPEAQQEADACRQHPDGANCAGLLAALDGGQRAEISTSGRTTFTFDAGKLVRLTMPVDDAADAATLELTKQFGPQSRNITIPGQNILGAKWENHVFLWDTPEANVTLYEDNDPSLSRPRLLLVVESRSQAQAKADTVSVKQLGANRNRMTHHPTSVPQTATLQ